MEFQGRQKSQEPRGDIDRRGQRWEGDGGRQDNEDHTFLVKHFQWPRWGRGFRKHLHFLPFGEFLLYFGVKASVHKTGEMEDTWWCVRSVPLIFPVYR